MKIDCQIVSFLSKAAAVHNDRIIQLQATEMMVSVPGFSRHAYQAKRGYDDRAVAGLYLEKSKLGGRSSAWQRAATASAFFELSFRNWDESSQLQEYEATADSQLASDPMTASASLRPC